MLDPVDGSVITFADYYANYVSGTGVAPTMHEYFWEPRR